MHHTSHIQTTSKIQDLHDGLLNALQSKFGDAILSSSIDYDFPVFVIRKNQTHEILEFLKTSEFGFHFLTTMCGIHFPDNKGEEFALMYQLHNLEKNLRIRIKTFMSVKDIEMPTVTDIWPAANWMEREAYDFYGFKFKGHPDLRRILNMDEMNYHPLRKEYPLEDLARTDKEDKFFGR